MTQKSARRDSDGDRTGFGHARPEAARTAVAIIAEKKKTRANDGRKSRRWRHQKAYDIFKRIYRKGAHMRALESGQLAGYAGDVWFPQPAPRDHPWRTMPRIRA
jgi:hypothetical protein